MSYNGKMCSKLLFRQYLTIYCWVAAYVDVLTTADKNIQLRNWWNTLCRLGPKLSQYQKGMNLGQKYTNGNYIIINL